MNGGTHGWQWPLVREPIDMTQHRAIAPSISVVIPCFNQGLFLPDAVNSVVAQTLAAHEIIVVDDGSTDETAMVAQRFGNAIAFIQRPNGGVAAARNTGLSRATGDFVNFLDADDRLLPGMIAANIRALKESSAAVTCCGWRDLYESGSSQQGHVPSPFDSDPFRALLPINRCPPLCWLMRRELLNSVGGFDEDRRLSGHADWDLLLRLAASGARFEAIPEILAAYRTHTDSMSRRYSQMYDSGIAVLEKNRACHPVRGAHESDFRKAYLAFYNDYVGCIVQPAVADAMRLKFDFRNWTHFVTSSIARPRLAMVVLGRMLAKLRRRIVFAQARQR